MTSSLAFVAARAPRSFGGDPHQGSYPASMPPAFGRLELAHAELLDHAMSSDPRNGGQDPEMAQGALTADPNVDYTRNRLTSQ